MNGDRDPVHDAQRAFRALLQALSQPGTIVRMEDPLPSAPGIPGSLAAAALTLFDSATTVSVDRTHPALEAWIRTSTGAPVIGETGSADFVVVPNAATLESFAHFACGTDADPESSATLLVAVEALHGGANVLLHGPGIADVRGFAPQGIPEAFWPAWSANAASYPRGIDCVFFAGSDVAGLPRTARATR